MTRFASNVIAAITMAVATTGCSSHVYSKQARVYADAITDELVKIGACATVDTCQKNQMVLWEGGGWKIGSIKMGGVSVEVYKVASREVADALIERCKQIHRAYPEVAMSLTIQSNAHIDNLHPGERIIVKEVHFEAAKS